MQLGALKSAGPARYNTITRRAVKPRTLPLQLSKHSTQVLGAVIKHLAMAVTRQFLHRFFENLVNGVAKKLRRV